MNIITFFIISSLIFILVTIIGSVFCNTKSKTLHSITISSESHEIKLANAMPASNDYENFDNILKVVTEEYPKAYKAAGQVYNNYE